MRTIQKTLIAIILLGFAFQSSADYPIVSHRYLADPGALVHNGRVYLYCSNDNENSLDDGYDMQSIVCVSSADLKNWTDHGVVFRVPRDASWSGKSWAPSVAERNGMFYLYFGDGGSRIGVAASDSPVGPFTDPIGTSLVNSATPGVMPAENMWLFDPMTFIDDDGQAYMYFGGNGEDNLRVIRLNEDMITTEGDAMQFHVPYFFEASWMHKHNGTYYFSYSTNPQNGMRIDYLTSDNPTSGFTYGGIVSPQPPTNNNNNHQAIFEFNGTWYEAYHNRYLAAQNDIRGTYKRNLCLDSIYHRPDGSIQTMVNTRDGLPQVILLNPYKRNEAETINTQSGIDTEVSSAGGMKVTSIDRGDWIKVRGVDFGTAGSGTFSAVISSEKLFGATQIGAIELRIDAADGTSIGTLPVSYTGSFDNWKTETIAVDVVTGVHDLYFVYTGDDTHNSFQVDYWSFSEKTATKELTAINATLEAYKVDTREGINTTGISVSAIYSDGSSEDVTNAATYTFDKEGIVTVNDKSVQGISNGTVNITAGYNGFSDVEKIMVSNIEGELTVAQVVADSSMLSLPEGGSYTLEITAIYEDGHSEVVTELATYSNPAPEVASINKGVITAKSEGEVDFTISYRGQLGEARETIVHLSVSKGEGIWLEAECGNVGSNWNIIGDNTASQQKYVSVKPGIQSLQNAPADTSGLISFEFNVETAGTYTIYTRVICPSPDDDSFWFKMDNGSFSMWNGVPGSQSWIWTDFPNTFNLSAGTHTLSIGYREDGALLDKIWITTTGDAITGLGSEADNCIETGIESYGEAMLKAYPNPATNEIYVELDARPATVTLLNTSGAVVFKQHRVSDGLKIDMAGLEQGIYLLQVEREGQQISKKIVKAEP